MKAARRCTLSVMAVLAALLVMGSTAMASSPGPGSLSRCGKGYVSEDAQPRSWRGIARGISPMLDVLIPPLADRVAAAGVPSAAPTSRSSGLARAERSLLSGAVAAVVSAGLAAIGGALESSPGDDPARDPATEALFATEGPSSSSCPEASDEDLPVAL